MADSTISGLTAASTLTGTEVAAVDQSGVTVKATTQNIANLTGAVAQTRTASLTLRAGTTAAATAPLYLQSGPLMSSAEVGAVEFLTDKLYFTITTGAARKEITLNDAALTSGRVPYATTNGRMVDSDTALTWDTANGGRLGVVVGATALAASSADRGLYLSRATSTYAVVESSLNTGYAGILLRNNSGDAGTFVTLGSTFVTSGMYQAANTYLTGQAANDLWVAATTSGKAVRIVAGGTATSNEICRFSAAAITVADAANFVINTSTGTKIGTGTTQKIGFWNATPVAQKTGYGTPTGNTNQGSFAAGSITLPNLAAHVAQLCLDLKAIGIIGA